MGIDLSEEMVNRARGKHPGIHFQAGDIRYLRTEGEYDAVFSHAVLHWIQDAESVVQSIRLALRTGGRFVAEFAGRGNVAVLTTAMEQELTARGYTWEGRSPWYFPSIGEYASLLELHGFRVTLAQHFDQPSPIKANTGLRKWLDSFAVHFFPDVTPADQASICEAIERRVRPQLFRDNQWMLDTSRLRIAATKES